MTGLAAETDVDVLIRLLRQYGRCTNCHGTLKYDHGTGEGEVDECIYDDKNQPPHRYCPCKVCKGSGLRMDVEIAIKRFNNPKATSTRTGYDRT